MHCHELAGIVRLLVCIDHFKLAPEHFTVCYEVCASEFSQLRVSFFQSSRSHSVFSLRVTGINKLVRLCHAMQINNKIGFKHPPNQTHKYHVGRRPSNCAVHCICVTWLAVSALPDRKPKVLRSKRHRCDLGCAVVDVCDV